jgi:hypothetical protein
VLPHGYAVRAGTDLRASQAADRRRALAIVNDTNFGSHGRNPDLPDLDTLDRFRRDQEPIANVEDCLRPAELVDAI